MPTVLAILADGFEEIEMVTPIDLLRRAGVTVTLASIGDGIHVTGRSGLTMHADTTLAALAPINWDAVFLPGGPGVKLLRTHPAVLTLVRAQHAAGRLLAAICAAPTVLHDAGVLAGHRYTAHFSVAGELTAILTEQRVVLDRNILTSRGAGTALDFGLALVEQLAGKPAAESIAQSISA